MIENPGFYGIYFLYNLSGFALHENFFVLLCPYQYCEYEVYTKDPIEAENKNSGTRVHRTDSLACTGDVIGGGGLNQQRLLTFSNEWL